MGRFSLLPVGDAGEAQFPDYRMAVNSPVSQQAQPPSVQPPGATQLTPLGHAAQGAFAGLGAASQAGESYDTASAVVNVGSSVASAALAGGLAGGPVGALAAGGTALIASGLNAWLGVRSENKRKSQIAQLEKEARERQDRIDRLARADALSELAYDRKKEAFNAAWVQAQAKQQQIMEAFKNNESLRDKYLQTGIPNAA